MESSVFPKPEISQELSKYVLLRLYTDNQDDSMEVKFQTMQNERYKTVMLPLYVIMSPSDSTPIAKIGYTPNEAKFKEFLVNASSSQVSLQP